MPSALTLVNSTIPLPSTSSFTLPAPPRTDIFASPTAGYTYNAPILQRTLPTLNFTRARVTIICPTTLQFDQGGVLVAFPTPENPAPDASNAAQLKGHPRWIKAGMEMWEGVAWISVVVRNPWADWSTMPAIRSADGKTVTLTLELERLGGTGDALMIYEIESGSGQRRLIRKVPWCFLKGETEENIIVGVYSARPDPFGEADGDLDVKFENLVIEEVEA